MKRAMNLGDRQIAVEIEGRQFTLKQMPRLPLQRILDLLYASDVEPEKGKGKKEKERTATEIMFAEWDKALPLLARMLGFQPEKNADEFEEIVRFLDENLAPMAAARLFASWYELNEIDDFFARVGKTLLDPRLAEKLKEERAAALDHEIQTIMSGALTEANPPAAANPEAN